MTRGHSRNECLIQVGLVLALQLVSTLCFADDFGCNHNLCNRSNPCNRGCKCTYPEGATIGYCRPWYESNARGKDGRGNTETEEYAIGTILSIVSGWNAQAFAERVAPQRQSGLSRTDIDRIISNYRKLGKLKVFKSPGVRASIALTAVHVTESSASYTVKLDFDEGPAEVAITLVRLEEGWKIAKFGMASVVAK